MRKAPIVLTDEIPAPPALVRLGIETLPATIGARNERTRLRFIQFFTANIRNRNTRCAERSCFGTPPIQICRISPKSQVTLGGFSPIRTV